VELEIHELDPNMCELEPNGVGSLIAPNGDVEE
jgi:hypothetical protein